MELAGDRPTDQIAFFWIRKPFNRRLVDAFNVLVVFLLLWGAPRIVLSGSGPRRQNYDQRGVDGYAQLVGTPSCGKHGPAADGRPSGELSFADSQQSRRRYVTGGFALSPIRAAGSTAMCAYGNVGCRTPPERYSVVRLRTSIRSRWHISNVFSRLSVSRACDRWREAAWLQCGRHAQPPRFVVDATGCSMVVWRCSFASKTVTC